MSFYLKKFFISVYINYNLCLIKHKVSIIAKSIDNKVFLYYDKRMSEMVLSTKNLCKIYNNRKVVNNVSLNVKRGEIYGFIGLNGAGKTTFIRMIAGLITPSSGSYTLFDKSGKELDGARKKIASIIEKPIFYPNMSGLENLSLYMSLLKKDKSKAVDYLKMVQLNPASKQKVKEYSLGMKQRLSIAMALSAEAEFLLLDEPTNGLDPNGMYEIRELLKNLNKEKGVTILISSHILAELSKLANRFGFIHCGRLIKEASLEEIATSLQKTYILSTSQPQKTLELFGQKAKPLKDNAIEVIGDITVSELFRILESNNIEILSFNTKQPDLEEYFRSLIGGGK